MGFNLAKYKKPKLEGLTTTIDTHLNISAVRFSDQCSMFFVGTEEGGIYVWKIEGEISTNPQISCLFSTKNAHESRITSIDHCNDLLVTGSLDGTLIFWQRCQTEFKKLNTLNSPHKTQITGILVCRNLIFTSSCDNSVKCWLFSHNNISFMLEYNGHGGSILNMLYIPLKDCEVPSHWRWDGPPDILVTASCDSTAKIFSIMKGNCLLTLKKHRKAVMALAVNSLCETILTGSADSTIIWWKLTTGECLMTFSGHNSPVTCLLMTNVIAFSGSMDGTVKTWIMEDENEIGELRGHGHSIRRIKMINNNILTCGGDGLVCIFDPNDGISNGEIRHNSSIMEINSFDDFLVTISGDGDIKLTEMIDVK